MTDKERELMRAYWGTHQRGFSSGVKVGALLGVFMTSWAFLVAWVVLG